MKKFSFLLLIFSTIIFGFTKFGLKDILMECDFNANVEMFSEKLKVAGNILEEETRMPIKFVYKLLKKVNEESFGLSETEMDLEGDRWFWIDDSAKVLEMLVIPEIYEKNKDLADKLINFILSLTNGQLILRRKSSNGMHPENKDQTNFKVHNGLISLAGNLDKSNLEISYRFHDGRQENKVDCFQTRVIFECDGESIERVSESFIESSQILSSDEETEFKYKFKILSNSQTKVAEIDHSCKLLSNSPVLFCKAIFTPISKNIKNLSIITVQRLHTDNSKFQRTTFSIDGKINFQDTGSKDERVKEVKIDGNVDFISVTEMFDIAYRYGAHRFYKTQKNLKRIQIVSEASKECISEVNAVYEYAQVNGKIEIAENLLITAGGFYYTMELYQDLFKTVETKRELIDYSISYDYGAELNSLALYYYFGRNSYYFVEEEKLDLIEQWIYRHYDNFYLNFIQRGNKESEGNCANLFPRGGKIFFFLKNT